jgi:hypothetical protein
MKRKVVLHLELIKDSKMITQVEKFLSDHIV